MKALRLYKTPTHLPQSRGRNYARLLKTLCLFSLITGYQSLFSSYSPAASLNRAEALYLQGSYSESINECGVNIARDDSPDSALYLAGLNYLRINDTVKAREKLTRILDDFKSSRYLEAAKLAYADTFFMEQDYAKAGQLYKDMLNANSKLSNAILLRLSQCALKSGNWPKAREYTDSLKQKYPLSLDANISANTLKWIDNRFFTVQVGSFASPQNAGKLSEKLKKNNFDSYIEETGSGTRILYRVRVGKLNTRRQAESLKQELEDKGYPARIYP